MKNILNMYFATNKTCNLSCEYCYLPISHKNQKNVKSDKIINSLKKFIQKVENENYKIDSFCFHGAEPGLMSPGTLAKCTTMVLRHKELSEMNGSVAIQTNGTMFDTSYLYKLKFLIGDTHKLRIGFSIDPPKIVHDKLRNGTFDKVIQNYTAAMELGFPVSILSVFSKDTINSIDGFIDWMKTQFQRHNEFGNPYKIKMKLATGDKELSQEEITYLSDKLIENDLTSLIQILSPGYCLQRGNECDWYEFDVDGNCYSCNKVFDDAGIFANWHIEPFDSITNKRENLYSNYFENEECHDCEFEMLCNSGCPVDRYKAGQMKGKAHECTMIKNILYTKIDQGKSIAEFYNDN